MHSLEQLVVKYGTDKNVSCHSSTYSYLFNNIRKDVTSVLEIGIGTVESVQTPSSFIGVLAKFPHYTPGGSLRVWRDFFPNAKVHGIDIIDDCKITEERIETFIFDSTDKQLCNQNLNLNVYDIIIDDGAHDAQSQIKTLSNLFYRVKAGGYYIIEDIGGVVGGAPDFMQTVGEEFCKIVNGHEFTWPLSNIVVIKKSGSNKGKVDKIFNLSNISDETLKVIERVKPVTTNKDLTIVTGLWNIGRPGRSFDHYLEHFSKFLETANNMFIYIPAELESFVWERRSKDNTAIKILETSDILGNYYAPFKERTEKLRTDPNWFNQTGENGWLKTSPQAVSEMYNPIVQSKMFMLHDAKVFNSFGSEYYIWLDAGITNTVYEKFFTENKALDKIMPHLKTMLFLSYPYETKTEIHGFEKKAIDRFAKTNVNYVCRGGLFGGHKDFISQANATYYSLLNDTLTNGYMGTEESIFSIMANVEPHLYRRYELDGNGLIVKFIQALIDDKVELASVTGRSHVLPKGIYNEKVDKTSLYMLTFNNPEQVQYTIDTWNKNSPDWLLKPRKILIDNSNNADSVAANKVLADLHGFEHLITGKNGGICGGRQIAAEHFHASDSKYYFFFEDDMGMNASTNNGFCRNGFRLFVPDLYRKVHQIMAKEGFDYLKLSFTEVYMDNHIQVSWYNVPQLVRSAMWPDYDQLPVTGLDPHTPRTKFDRIDIVDGLSYIVGDIYYANWPMIMDRKGNQKCFIDTKWTYPYEQTWMSHMFQETIKKNLSVSVLLAAPICHNRIKYYGDGERREN